VLRRAALRAATGCAITGYKRHPIMSRLYLAIAHPVAAGQWPALGEAPEPRT
jgi:hypothetical protein